MNLPIITIDGPSGVGKGTIGAELVKRTGFHFLDSGSLYRATALYLSQKQVDLNDEKLVFEIASTLPITFENGGILLDNVDISKVIRTEEIGKLASTIAACDFVRKGLLQLQYSFAKTPGLIADGRDMGTVIFPNAPCKIFLTASAEVRAKRRLTQLQEQGQNVDYQTILEQIVARDNLDKNRAISPSVPASDALIIDSSHLNIAEVLDIIWQKVQQDLHL
jgi:cytidylate kinase